MLEAEPEPDQDQDRGNHTVTFRGERRSNQTHVSTTDPDAKLAKRENRHRLLVGINVESFRGPASETNGGRKLLDTFPQKHGMRIQTVAADKGYSLSRFSPPSSGAASPRTLRRKPPDKSPCISG